MGSCEGALHDCGFGRIPEARQRRSSRMQGALVATASRDPGHLVRRRVRLVGLVAAQQAHVQGLRLVPFGVGVFRANAVLEISIMPKLATHCLALVRWPLQCVGWWEAVLAVARHTWEGTAFE